MLDYFKLGEKIRYYRKNAGISQEELAEKVYISTTHMSHIETGSTKLSLQVLIDISDALNVSIDKLINVNDGAFSSTDEIMKLLSKCSDKQLNLIENIIKAVINSEK